MSWLNIEKGTNYDTQGNVLRTNLHTATMNNATNIRIFDYGAEGTLYIADNMFNNLQNANIDITNAKFEKVVSAVNMFCNCKQINSLSNINMPNVSNGYQMFARCDKLTEIDAWSFDNIKICGSMFRNCKNLTDTIPLNISNAAIGRMFSDCENFNPKNVITFTNCNLDGGGWDSGTPFANTAITNMDNIRFINTPINMANCKSLQTASINIEPTDNISYAFQGCSNLVSVNIIAPNGFTDVNYGISDRLFSNCSNLSEVHFDNINCLNGSYIFLGCNNLHNINGVNYFRGAHLFRDSSNIMNVISYIDNLDLTYTNSVYGWFAGTDIEREPNWDWENFTADTMGLYSDTTNILDTNGFHLTDGQYLFQNSKIQVLRNLVRVGNFTPTSYISWSSAFDRCTDLTDVYDLDLITLNLKSLQFGNCHNLRNITLNSNEELGLSFNFVNSKFTQLNINLDENIYLSNASFMFANCTELIDMSSLTDIGVDNGYNMFNNCRNLITVGNLDFSNATTIENFCRNCINLVNVGTLDFSNIHAYGLSRAFYACNNLSATSINNIINAILTINNSNVSGYNNLMVNNWASPFNGSNITSSRYSTRLSELSAKGWIY